MIKDSTYGWISSESPDSCNYIGPEIMRLVKRFDPARVLDIGSGNGSLCESIKRFNPKIELLGIENDIDGVKIATENVPDVKFYNYSIYNDPKELIDKEELFDLVISTEVIEHLFYPAELIKFANHLAKPKGKLIITTPYHGYLKNLLLSIFNKWDIHLNPFWDGGHIKFWSRKTLQKIIEQNGFKVLSFGGVGRIPYLWKSMIIVAEKY